jgi:arylsulfatase A-like enzyme
MNRPNIILFITDQQRWDTIQALGASWMRTPTLDRLAAEGTAFTHCFTTSPICVGARASLFSGCFPHTLNVYQNFDPWEPTWVRWLAQAGYHCVSIGKMHINPYDAKGGFHQRFPVENKDRALFLEEPERAIYDEWDKALNARGFTKPSRYTRFAGDPEGFRRALGAFVWDLPDELHSDNFIGDTVLWWLEQRRATNPLFLQIGFCGPHPPYDPVERYLDLYRDAAIPVPEVTEDDLNGQPSALHALRRTMEAGNFDSIAWRRDATKSDLLRLRRHYAANITMIDEKIGQILERLERRGYLRDALIVFTSDHGDNLGDHGHIQKHNMYEGAVRVPLLTRFPGRVPEGKVIDHFVQWMDVAPTILDCAGVAVPKSWESRSLWPLIEDSAHPLPERDAVYAELARDHIQTAAELMVMRRDRNWKVVFYLGESDGELYDLERDPNETKNLWNRSEHRELREGLIGELLRWQVAGTLRSRMQERPTPQQPMSIQ